MRESIDITEGRRLLDRRNAAEPTSYDRQDAAYRWHGWVLDNAESLLDVLERVQELALNPDTAEGYTDSAIVVDATLLQRALDGDR